jgi:hypothetical protein
MKLCKTCKNPCFNIFFSIQTQWFFWLLWWHPWEHCPDIYLDNFCIILGVVRRRSKPIDCYHQHYTKRDDKFSIYLVNYYQCCMMHVNKSYIRRHYNRQFRNLLQSFLHMYWQYRHDYFCKDLISFWISYQYWVEMHGSRPIICFHHLYQSYTDGRFSKYLPLRCRYYTNQSCRFYIFSHFNKFLHIFRHSLLSVVKPTNYNFLHTDLMKNGTLFESLVAMPCNKTIIGCYLHQLGVVYHKVSKYLPTCCQYHTCHA